MKLRAVVLHAVYLFLLSNFYNMAWLFHSDKTALIRFTVESGVRRHTAFSKLSLDIKWYFYICAVDIRYFLNFSFKFVDFTVYDKYTPIIVFSPILQLSPRGWCVGTYQPVGIFASHIRDPAGRHSP